MAGLGSGFQIRVTSDQLRFVADDAQTCISELETQWNDLCIRVDRTQTYWVGKGAETKRKELKTLEKDVERMIRRLREYHTDLMETAGLYDKAENENKNLTGSLPIDVIF